MGKEFKEVKLIGEKAKIPSEWKVEKLEDNISVLTGDSFNSDHFNSDKEGVPLVRIRNLDNNNIDTYYRGEYEDKYFIESGDILIGMDGNFYVTKWDNGKALLNQRVCKIEEVEDFINYDYLFYRIKPEIQKIEHITPATTVKHLSVKDIRRILLPIPPLPEQKKIADILSSVDRAIERTDEIIEKTEELKKGLMQELLIKGIGHDEFKEVRIGAKKEKIPCNWHIEKLSDLATEDKNAIVDGPYGSSIDTSTDYISEGIPVIRTVNIRPNKFISNDLRFISEELFQELKRSAVYPGDIILSKVGTIGYACILPNDIKKAILSTTGSCKITVDENKAYNKFISYQLNYFKPYLDRIASQSVQPFLNLKTIRNLMLVVPTLHEQKKIASILSSVDSKIQKEKKYKEKLEELKKGLMQKLLTGEVRVKTAN